jgi:hypothetical protein
MRTSLCVLSLALMVGGCGDSGTTGARDMASKGDMATPQLDLASATPMLGCKGYLDCQNACPNPPDFDACNSMCKKMTKTASYTKYANALNCGQVYCLGNKDAGTAKCGLNAAMTMLTEVDGSPICTTPGCMSVCGTCLNNALEGLFGGTCNPATSPDCNPAMCTSLYNACMSDM